MDMSKGAMSIAEGNHKYKTDVSLVLNGKRVGRQCVLRTSLDQLGVWKAKYVNTAMSPFEAHIKTVVKDAAIIDKEVWVFGIDSTRPQDIVLAVEIAMRYYNVRADEILSDVYVKNLNVEQENTMGSQAVVSANKKLYSGVCKALTEAARTLSIKGALNLWVISSNINQKIPKDDLHVSLKSGGATSVTTDDAPHAFISGSNDGLFKAKFKTNLHLAELSI